MNQFKHSGVLTFKTWEKVFLGCAALGLFTVPMGAHLGWWGQTDSSLTAYTMNQDDGIDREPAASQSPPNIFDLGIPASVTKRAVGGMLSYLIKVEATWLHGDIDERERDRRIEVGRAPRGADRGDNKVAYDLIIKYAGSIVAGTLEQEIVMRKAFGRALRDSDTQSLKRLKDFDRHLTDASIAEKIANDALLMKRFAAKIQQKGGSFDPDKGTWDFSKAGAGKGLIPVNYFLDAESIGALSKIFSVEVAARLISPHRQETVVLSTDPDSSVFLPPYVYPGQKAPMIKIVKFSVWKKNVDKATGFLSETLQEYATFIPKVTNYRNLMVQGHNGSSPESQELERLHGNIISWMGQLKKLGIQKTQIKAISDQLNDLYAAEGEGAQQALAILTAMNKATWVTILVAPLAMTIAGFVGAGAMTTGAFVGEFAEGVSLQIIWSSLTSISFTGWSVGSQALVGMMYLMPVGFTYGTAALMAGIDKAQGRRPFWEGMADAPKDLMMASSSGAAFMVIPLLSAAVIPVATLAGASATAAGTFHAIIDLGVAYYFAQQMAGAGLEGAKACAESIGTLIGTSRQNRGEVAEVSNAMTKNCAKGMIDLTMAISTGHQFAKSGVEATKGFMATRNLTVALGVFGMKTKDLDNGKYDTAYKTAKSKVEYLMDEAKKKQASTDLKVKAQGDEDLATALTLSTQVETANAIVRSHLKNPTVLANNGNEEDKKGGKGKEDKEGTPTANGESDAGAAKPVKPELMAKMKNLIEGVRKRNAMKKAGRALAELEKDPEAMKRVQEDLARSELSEAKKEEILVKAGGACGQ